MHRCTYAQIHMHTYADVCMHINLHIHTLNVLMHSLIRYA